MGTTDTDKGCASIAALYFELPVAEDAAAHLTRDIEIEGT